MEEQLLKNKSGENLLSAKVAELEDKLQQAEAAEEEAKEKAAAFYEELSVASNKPDQEALQKLDHLEKELVKVKALEDSLAEKMAKLESKDKEMTIVKKQLDAEKSQSSEKERKINVLNEELKKYKSTETELQKKISSLEDAVTKANNLTQSAVSCLGTQWMFSLFRYDAVCQYNVVIVLFLNMLLRRFLPAELSQERLATILLLFNYCCYEWETCGQGNSRFFQMLVWLSPWSLPRRQLRSFHLTNTVVFRKRQIIVCYLLFCPA